MDILGNFDFAVEILLIELTYFFVTRIILKYFYD